jgi:hypothetical protein
MERPGVRIMSFEAERVEGSHRYRPEFEFMSEPRERVRVPGTPASSYRFAT